MTGLNHAASIHFLAAIDNGGYFEGDISKDNKSATSWCPGPTAWTRTAWCGRSSDPAWGSR